MSHEPTIGELLKQRGVSRRAFLKFCAATASLMALPPSMAAQIAETLVKKRRPSVIYLSFQECTGCLESLSRSHQPRLETLLFDVISLDYDDTLQAAAGSAAERARDEAMRANYGKYILMIDGSVPSGAGGAYCTAAGKSALDSVREAAKGAAAIVCVGTCSSFGGIPYARPNPTGAMPISEIVHDRPIINVSGCPPIPAVITGTLVQFLTLGKIPQLDALHRPVAFYGTTIHDRCYRRPFYDRGKFARTFDDEGARRGWCLYELGCKGPTTYNACATVKWNDGTSFPIQSGHGCFGCAEPNFWDNGDFYSPLSTATGGWNVGATLGGAAGAGLVIGAVAAAESRRRRKKTTEDKTS